MTSGDAAGGPAPPDPRDGQLVHDALGRFVTLSAALTGGGVYLLNADFTLGLPFRLAVVLLLVALGCALKGLLTGVGAGPDTPTPEGARRALRAKAWWLQRSASALLFGLALAVLGALLRMG